MASGTASFSFARWRRLCWQLLAVILVLFALSVSLIRGLLPKLDDIRQDVVGYLQQEYGITVQVGSLAAQWQAFGPALTVNHLVLPPQQGLPVTLIISRVQLKLDFWQTLLTASPQIEDVLFDKVDVALDIDQLHRLSGTESSANMDWLYRLLLAQLERFSMQRVKLQLLSQRHDYRPIYLKKLYWLNRDNRHRGQGSLHLDADASKHELLDLRFDLRGDGNRPDSITGQIYLAARGLDLGEWASRRSNPFNPKEALPLTGVVNLQAWLDVSRRQIDSGYIAFSPSYLQWQLNGQQQKFSIQSGALSWQPEADGWQLQTRQLKLATNDQPWPDPHWVVRQQGQQLYAHSDPLLAQRLLPLLPLIPGITLDELYGWQQMQPKGNIGPVALYWTLESTPRIQAQLQQLSWRARGALPGMSPLDATLGWQAGKLYFMLPQQQLTADFNGGFKQPITATLSPLSGVYDTADSTLLLPGLQLDNPDIALQADTRLSIAGQPFLSLAASLQLKNAARAQYYFPLHSMDKDLVAYLSQALTRGHSQDAKVLWHGYLADFPYQDHSGIFQAGFTLDDASFAFQPDWPAVQPLTLGALFQNNAMALTIEQGKLLAVDVSGAQVDIATLGEHSVLTVKGDIHTHGQVATELMQHSALKDTVGATLDAVQVRGALDAKLDLAIPLYDGGTSRLNGQINLRQNQIRVTAPGIVLDGVDGVIGFANDKVSSDKLTAKVFGQPVILDFATAPQGTDYGLSLNASGSVDTRSLPITLHNPLSEYYQGRSDWQGRLTMMFDDTGYRLQARVDSDLHGMALTLPVPFAKPADTVRPLQVEVVGDNKQTGLGLRLGQQAEFWGGFDPCRSGMSHYDLLLGRLFRPGDTLGHQGGHIWLDLDKMALDNWLPVIHSFVPAPSAPSALQEPSATLELAASPNSSAQQAQPTHEGAQTFQAQPTLPAQQLSIKPNAAAQQVNKAVSAISTATANVNLAIHQDAKENVAAQSAVSVADNKADSPVTDNTANAVDTDSAAFPSLKSISGSVKQLNLLGQTLTDVALSVQPTDNAWRISADSHQFAGHVDFYPDWHSQGLKLVASRLYLSPITSSSDTQSDASKTDNADAIDAGAETKGADLAEHAVDLPPLALDVDDFRYDNKPLGHLVLQGSPDNQGYVLQTLSLHSPQASLTGSGRWLYQGSNNITQLDLRLSSGNFDELTQVLGIDPGVKDAPLELTASLNWQGAPYDFAISRFSGDVTFALGKGHLSQISDKGARIFSLFSLDSLLRKLSLDFSDVFGKGLYFNSFGGTLQIDNGVVSTTDTEMDAIAGNMKVRGFTDLRTDSLNYDIRFVPQLASSVPTVVLLSTSAWTLGLGAFALTKVLEPVIEVISEIRFRLTGTLSDPKLEEVERKSKEIEIPESVLPKAPAQRPQEAPQDHPGTSAKVIPITQGGQYAGESAAVSEQPRYSGQSDFYRQAA
ncbi:hypothetical protein NFHSH190041_05550 [Shewanella sp. NFH-SH190041]|uniref:YhdP family protein n=1 Tax=Shewanella sp. NFH-SH190041 TaxID=2950245 RepID=UPI0021C3331D|nr:YhdP family protein [Shewanella sp. NFH-SH190041]BDM63103.1 hypothetical protein NFHSH190041_05550 [Shewanella sp. NFH-SH190041]